MAKTHKARGKNRHQGKNSAHAPKGSYWLYGWHAVAAAIGNDEREILRLVATQNSATKLRESGLLEARETPLIAETTQPSDLEQQLPSGAVHQGIAAWVSPLEDAHLDDVADSPLPGPILLLDQLTDPHNVGAILRSAAAFDARGVVMTDRHAPPESGALAKAAAGALDCVPVARETNLAQTINTLKKLDYWIVGLDGYADKTVGDAPLDGRIAIVLGAEGKGMRELTAKSCDFLIKIPMGEQMESLNVSNAAAILLYECHKSLKL